MPSYSIILFIPLFIVSVQAQNWLGTYTPDNACSLITTCCCVSGQVVVSNVSTGFYGFTTGLSGSACGGMSSYMTNLSTPTGYTTTISIPVTISGITIALPLSFALSADSLSINVTNQLTPTCRGTLTKSTSSTGGTSTSSFAIHQSQWNIVLLFVMAGIGFMRSI